MKKIILFLIPCVAFAGTEPMNVNTTNGHIKQTSSGAGSLPKPFDFSDVHVIGLSGSGIGTLTDVTAENNSGYSGGGVLSLTGVVTLATDNNLFELYDGGSNKAAIKLKTQTGAALTKSDDTNVTLSLGGSASTALVNAASLTLGWAGTLAISRGGFGKAMTDPNADRLIIWDDTDGDFQFVTVGTGLTYTHATHTLTSASGTIAATSAALAGDGAGNAVAATTSTTATFGTIELTNATANTLTASSGILSIESVAIPTISSTHTLTNKRITARSSQVSNSTTLSINVDNVDYVEDTGLTGAVAVDVTGTPTVGQKLWVSLTGTASRAITWDGTDFEASTVALPTTTSSTNRLDVGFIWNPATSKFRCVAAQ